MAKYDTSIDTWRLPVRAPHNLPVHAGKGYLVTGAARGLGRAVAEELLGQGARVAVLDVLEDELSETAARLGGPAAGVHPVIVDLADRDSIAAASHEAFRALGAVDGLANVAGVARQERPLDIPWETWRFVFDVNLFGTHEMSQHVARHLRDRGRPGAIVNVASEAGKVGHVESMPYGASKAALINETRMMAVALAGYDINVNCVCPGGLPTPMLRKAANGYSGLTGEDADAIYEQMIVAGQLGRSVDLREVARVITFLLSDDAVVIRGQAINVDAGATPY